MGRRTFVPVVLEHCRILACGSQFPQVALLRCLTESGPEPLEKSVSAQGIGHQVCP